MNKIVLAAVVIGIAASIVRPAEATLIAAGDGRAVYDTVKDLTWLANANLAASQTFGVKDVNPDGSMSWDAAQRWIAALNAARYLGSNRWRLPATQLLDESCSQRPAAAAFGFGCLGSDMGSLYYNELGGVKGSTIKLTHNAAYSLFTNFQPYLYWSSTLWEKGPQ